ncbi:MAG: hypothetical protein GX927_13210 [Lentisphaerae bacterium]|nr:hypothetical protein [Lentisphaerota bacterium]
MTTLHLGVHYWLDQAWVRLFLAVCVLFLLHLPFSMLSIRTDQSLQESPGIQLPAVVSLPSVYNDEISMFERNLYAWANIADPRRMLHPDLEHGFSRFANPVFSYPTPSLPVWTLEPCFWPRKEYPESSLAVASKSLAELIREQWNRDTTIFLLPHEKAPLPQGVFWRLSGSTKQISGLQMPADFSSLAGTPDEVKKVTGMTLLEVSRIPFMPYPRITLRKSCGNARFDQLAIRVLREYLLSRSRKDDVLLAASASKSVQSWLLEVDWRLSQFGNER